jgi:hypothetical protein
MQGNSGVSPARVPVDGREAPHAGMPLPRGGAADADPKADVRGTDEVAYFATGIDWASSAAIVFSWPSASASASVPSPEIAALNPSETSA